jgi:uncharacterized protein
VLEFVEKRWIRLATLDPETGEVHIYRDGLFEPLAGETPALPSAGTSIAYYDGKMEHLPLARIGGRA